MMRLRRSMAVGGLVLGLAACASDPSGQRTTQPGQGTAVGAGLGAVAGAVIGNVVSDRKNKDENTVIGAAIGAAVGGGIGFAFDDQQQAFEQALQNERAAGRAEVERVRQDLLRITLDSEVSFDTDSAELKPAFQPTLSRLADVLNKYSRSNATIVGHTDDRGSAAYNQDLSLRRADSVRFALVQRGVPDIRLSTQGMGESNPRASNASAAGRQLNRRVEILVAPSA